MSIALDTRIPDHPVDPLFVARWSPRAFTGEAISPEDLNSIFEAARWAPSSFNSQPWRFLYAHRDGADFPKFLDLLIDFNRQWAKNAAVLIVAVSARTFTRPGQTEAQPTRSHSFDTGAAWANLALQATKLGWHAHAMGGFDLDRARTVLNVPDDHQVEAAIAIGRLGDKGLLPESFHAGETPNGRRPVSSFALEGGFPAG